MKFPSTVIIRSNENRLKMASKEYNKQYYKNNREHIRASQKEHYQQNKAKINARCKKWREENSDYMRKYNKEYSKIRKIKEYFKEVSLIEKNMISKLK